MATVALPERACPAHSPRNKTRVAPSHSVANLERISTTRLRVTRLTSSLRVMEARSSNANGWQWQQTMLRIKDPAVSLPFYRDNFGLTLIAHLRFPEYKFDLYFLASLPEGEAYDLDPQSTAAQEYLWKGEYGGHRGVALELTHNYGSEDIAGPVYHPGNQGEAPGLASPGRDGFGHIAFNTDDVVTASAELEAQGVAFKKRPHEGRMPNIAFALDPDGYWVEIVSRKGFAPDIRNRFNLSQTMMRIKDPEKSLPFYQALGMTLIRTSPASDFCNYFLASLTAKQAQDLEDQRRAASDDEARQQVERRFLKSLFIPTLELTHNYGTETQAEFKHYSGNEPRPNAGSDGRGFGHIGFLVNDLNTACEELDKMGYGFKKRPEEGSMQDIAFALDPDGYWIEIVGSKMP